ncbi:aconitate hydratase [Lecanora helva]
MAFPRARLGSITSPKVVKYRCPHRAHKLRNFATEAISTQPSNFSRTPPYARLAQNLQAVRTILGSRRSLTLAEKILYSHLDNPEESLLTSTKNGKNIRGNGTLKLKPDRVAMQDASAQMALLQFMSCGRPTTAVPTSIHCDHMIVGERGADVDLPASITGNKEVFDFLESAAKKYGIEFWPPGAGIIHQTVLENYAAPGLLILGTDSHTPNAGGLGAVAIGVGGADAVDAMVDAPWELKAPKILGVELTGKLSGWATPKDIILKLAGLLTVRGGTGFIIEYFGGGVEAISCTGMGTVCNMGAEVGATTSIFPFTKSMRTYLQSTHRQFVDQQAAHIVTSEGSRHLLAPDQGAEYDELITINLAQLEPHINGPFTPDLSTPLSDFKQAVKVNDWPASFGAGLIGSCTNSSYQDMTRAEELVKQASAAGLKPKADFFVTPGSEQIRATLDRDSTLHTFASAGGTILANACGPCIGQWKRTDGVTKGETNAIFSSYNRNFKGRNDGNASTMNFLASPEIVTAMSYAGSTTFNPLIDTLPTPSGSRFSFSAPSGSELPPQGFAQGDSALAPTPGIPDSSCPVIVSPTSDRLALLEPFAPFPVGELESLRVLYKVRGQCTTDTISAAGPWLKYKGHLPNISANTLIGAVNAETGETNAAYDHFVSGEPVRIGIPQLAEKWKADGKQWMVVAESNYGEGSAREHAALQPRYLGGRVILAKSFARIHETNLKKQGVVPLTFENEQDYEVIKAGDTVSTSGLYDMLKAGGQGAVILRLQKRSGEEETIKVRHTISKDQARFILAGSALNAMSQA